jgi:hypothetical protein
MSVSTYVPGCTNYEIVTALSAQQSVTDGITAYAGGGQTNAVALTATFNNVATVATASDSVKLPLAVAGLWVAVRNGSANSLQVFGAGTDTINGVATATGVALATVTSGLYFCTASAPAGKWFVVKGA